MRKNGTLIYAGLLLALILLLSGFLLLRRGGGTPTIRTAKEAAVENRQSPSPSAASRDRERININTAGPEDLQSLPGIGQVRAEAIIAYREANGPFLSISDLTLVKGIGESTINRIKDMICLEDENENTDH